jgi:hypothetical protein
MDSLLPVTIVLPILNCAEKLALHLERIESSLTAVQSVVVVDSRSSDGSLDVARKGIRHPNAEFLSVPPGLYAAWNSGVAAVSTRWVYISTIGDWISPGGLQHLLEVAREFEADVVISPPSCVDADRTKTERRQFPSHQLLAGGTVKNPVLLPTWLVHTLATGFSIESLLGSSASNLYRTAFLQAHPFPTEFGKAGDTAWLRKNAFQARIALSPQEVADFVLDQDHGSKEPGEISELLSALNRVSAQALREWTSSNPVDAPALEILEAWRSATGSSPEKTLDAIRHLEGIAATNEQQRSYIAELQEEIEKMRAVMQTLDSTCATQRQALLQHEASSAADLLGAGLRKLFSRS